MSTRVVRPTHYHVNLEENTVGVRFAIIEDDVTVSTGRHILPLPKDFLSLLAGVFEPQLDADAASLDAAPPGELTSRLHQLRVAQLGRDEAERTARQAQENADAAAKARDEAIAAEATYTAAVEKLRKEHEALAEAKDAAQADLTGILQARERAVADLDALRTQQ